MLSIIIPVYNEEKIIRKILGTLPYSDNIEVIIVDGGSSDRTIEFAGQYPVKVVQSIKNRAVQMNKGAEMACGDILLFLHADCLLEKGSIEAIQDILKDGYGGGCLCQRINSTNFIFRCIEASGSLRAKCLKIFYGDQAIFVRRDIFFKLGGFDQVPLFEDVLFSKKIKKEVKTKMLNKHVFVSPRRWEENGIIKTTFINWLLTLGFLLNVPYDRLKKLYQDIR
ncbi:MAG: TIGR04283 family arsenosugar biosynthesis glycosyltransferase [Candidatus Omnitrophica bacterium]|nr:TIGR04283 family arsenosugar biosynthesis glycosyltransferase [Candidatus Omnitrophota bacterium]